MYKVDRTFRQKLKAIDRRLACTYNPDHEHFVITYQRAWGDPVPIMSIEGPGGCFRQPNEKDLEFICAGDMENMTLNERMNMTAFHFERTREQTRKQSRDLVRQLTRENRRQLMPAFARLTNAGKFNSAFRRINLRQRGQTLDQIQATQN